jgi:hypothetical protein
MSHTITTRPAGYAGHRIPGAVVALAVLAVALVVALAAFVLAGDESAPARPSQPAVEAPQAPPSDIGFTNDTQVLRNCPPRTACPS